MAKVITTHTQEEIKLELHLECVLRIKTARTFFFSIKTIKVKSCVKKMIILNTKKMKHKLWSFCARDIRTKHSRANQRIYTC